MKKHSEPVVGESILNSLQRLLVKILQCFVVKGNVDFLLSKLVLPVLFYL